ncbi:M12 family metallo-peptidase [Cyanobium gracile]|uniref:Calx-beta domain-containing protein n=1 Tax=Cyanobium gracile (strain ATCC 27147 / PCC 6307) TaxID=292564 RepID=K9P9W1_CYAGP|nr:M12 family metallo-peptidase [Cyanobium gracile]AFY29905.1 hypothetical protein Cyagr_2813 [Cyanobium gracile PCC 6307]
MRGSGNTLAGLEASDAAPVAQAAAFRQNVTIDASPAVATDSHQVLSDPWPGEASGTTAAATGPSCGCRSCSVLAVTSGDGAAAWDTASGQAPLVLDGQVTLGAGVDLSKVFQLHSNPTATKTIFLDFDGFSISSTPWENGGALSLGSFYSSFDTNALTEIQRIWQRVAEDFAPFHVNVTTEDPGSENLRKSGTGDERWGIRVAFTSNLNLLTGTAITNAGGGGTAYYNSFNWSTDDVALVFNRGEYTAAETASHEVGHTLGLSHDGAGSTTYYGGHGGAGPTSWGTIMGAAWLGDDENLTQWSKGEYFGANNTQDDLATITTGNGFTYRADDHGNAFSTATALTGLSFSSFGVIERNTDVDMFRFDTGAGLVSFNIVNASRAFVGSGGSYTTEYLTSRGANLDIGATLYRADGSVLQIFNPADLTTASFSLNLSEGTYYLGIDGVGAGTPMASSPNGYTDYASLGQYMVSGTVQATSGTFTTPPPPPAPTLVVSGATGLVTTEAGGAASFQVALSRAPSSDVTVRFSSSDATEGLVLTSTLLFTAANWQTPQTVTVQGVDDTLLDGSQTYSILMSTSSADPAFQGLSGPAVTIQNSDNEVATTTTTTTTVPVTFQASAGGFANNITYSNAPTVAGSLTAIHGSDDQRLAITEGAQRTNKGIVSTLNAYQWTFDNLSGANQLVFEGYRTASSSESFQIQYSSNGRSWTTAFTIRSGTESTYTLNLASPVSGRMFVRALDTKTSREDGTYDTLFVDRLVFLATTGAGRSSRSLEDPIIGGEVSLAPELAHAFDHGFDHDFAPIEAGLSADPALGGEPLSPLQPGLSGYGEPLVGFTEPLEATPWLIASSTLV